MNATGRSKGTRENGEFERARVEAKSFEKVQRDRASRTVAGHSIDAEDCGSLLSMLGLREETAPAKS